MLYLSADYERWLAGKTVRLHTAPQIRTENIAEHTHGVLTCLVRWHPRPSRDLLICATLHDMGENLVGDIPSPVLREDPELASRVAAKEHDFVENMLGFEIPELNLDEQVCLMLADKYDFSMFCYHEFRLGNKNLKKFAARSLQYIEQERVKLSRDRDANIFADAIVSFAKQIHKEMNSEY